MKRNIWSHGLLVLVLLILIVRPCLGAEDPAKFPSKPITMIIPTVGGSSDITGRKLADLATKILGQPVVVENKAGGGSVIGTTVVANAAPDGYTIGKASFGPLVYVPHMSSVPYKTKEDFSWIMQYADTTMVFCVRADSPWKTFKEFVEDARRNPGKLSFSSPGLYGGQHIFLLEVFSIEQVKLNYIPVTGGAEAATQLLGGHIDAVLTSETIPHVRAGKLRALAVQTENRHEQFPDLPTFKELGYTRDPVIWFGLFAPKGLHPVVVKKLQDTFKMAYDDPSFKELCYKLDLVPVYRDSESFKAVVHRDFDINAQLLKQFGAPRK